MASLVGPPVLLAQRRLAVGASLTAHEFAICPGVIVSGAIHD
jgi:hypothetical protein